MDLIFFDGFDCFSGLFLVGVMMEKYKMHSVWHPNSTSLCGWGLTKTWPLEGLISNKAHVC